MEMNEIVNAISAGALWMPFIIFIILSYLILSLLNWSFIKPLKYIGIPLIIVGFLLIIVRFANSFFVNILLTDIKIPNELIASVFKPLLIMGIIYIIVGFGMTFLSHSVSKNKKANVEQKTE